MMGKQLFIGTLLLAFGMGLAIPAAGQQSTWEQSPQRHYEEARRLYDEGLYAAASDGFERTLQLMGDERNDLTEQSSYFRAMSAVKLMNRNAEDLVSVFLADYPTSARRKEAILETTEYFFNRKKYKEARVWLQRLDGMALNQEERGDYKFKLGYSSMMTQDSKSAQLHFKEIKDGKSSMAPSAKYYYGHLAYLDSNYVTAIQNLSALRQDPQFGPVVPYYLAQMYYQTGDDTALFRLGKDLLGNATAKRAPEIAKLVGQSLDRQKRYAEAIPYLVLHRDQGGKMRPEDHYQLGVVYHATGKMREAMDALNKMAAGKSAVSQAGYYLLGDAYLKEGMNQEALSAFKAASDMEYDLRLQEEAFYHYAVLTYSTVSPFSKPIEAFQQFLAKYPQSEYKREANAYLANLYTTSRDYARALEAIQATGMASMAMREAYQKVAYFLGVEAYNVAQWTQAGDYFRMSLDYPLESRYVALAHFWLGELAFRADDPQESLSEFEQFLKVPGSYTLSELPIALYNKAYCLFALAKYEAASTAFRLFLDSKDADARRKSDATVRVADAYFMQGRYSQAEEFYRQYVGQKNPDADYASFQRALSLGLQGKQSEKLTVLNGMASTYPKSKMLQDVDFERASTLLRLDKNDEAAAAFVAFAEKYPQASQARRAQINAALAYRNKGDLNQAAILLKSVADKNPGTSEAREALSQARSVYDDLGRLEEYLDWVGGVAQSGVSVNSLDSLAYTSAYEKFASGKTAEGLAAFQAYIRRYPQGSFVLQAQHYRGESARALGKWDEALTAYRAVTDLPRSTYSENAYRWLGTRALIDKNYAESRLAFEKLLTLSEKPEDFRRANEGLMRCATGLKQYATSVQFAEAVLADDKHAPEVRSEAYVIKAHGLLAQGDSAAARAAFDQVVLRTRGGFQAEGFYYQALFLARSKDYSGSNESVFALIDNHPSEVTWRHKGLLLLAENYWGLNDKFQAQYTVDFLLEDSPSGEIKAKAELFKASVSSSPEITRDPQSAK
jgi:TolA-binding protein